jgi:hypothetical protein
VIFAVGLRNRLWRHLGGDGSLPKASQPKRLLSVSTVMPAIAGVGTGRSSRLRAALNRIMGYYPVPDQKPSNGCFGA